MATKRILLVEDDALIALSVETALIEGGYELAGSASRLSEALAIATAQPMDAAVLDINLDGEPVWPVAAVLHERGIPFVLLSGYGSELAVPEYCIHAPRLRKPFAYNAMMDVLNAMLAKGST